ncbi:filamentous hemagglutinin N-terminal domain-containing protein [Scytonema hofmannii]|nr:S-layer family protein [Scytonema hofmannii]
MGLSGSNCCWQLRVASFVAVCALDVASGNFAKAQIAPDSTLGAESSTLTPNVSIDGLPADEINGGAIRGTSLFHSFQQFNVGIGQRVFFANPRGIENIFSRVTGTNPSVILGTLGVNGGANLFLLNPNGIVFGPNARLDLRGSFLASTARSIKFTDSLEFSTTNPSAPPLLTLNMPIGLQYGENPGRILVQGQGNELKVDQETGEVLEVNRTGSLEVEPGQTLALAGGEVVLEGGSLSAESGRVEVWSVQGEGLVGLTSTNPGWELSDRGIQNFQDIRLSQTAAIDTSGVGGGNIQMQGRRVALENGSLVLSLTQGEGSGGTISIKGSESIEASGSAPNGEASLFLTETLGIGKAGDVKIDTKSLILQNGAQISSSTFNQGSSGKIIVNASELVEAAGVTQIENFASGLFSVARKNTGEGGKVEVTTRRLLLRDGAQVSATTFSEGKGGNVLVKASESVEATGVAPIGASGLFAVSESTGEGGQVEIDTEKLILQNGAQVSATAFNKGNGGDVLVNARESVDVIGTAQNGNFGSGLGAQTQGTGNGGRVEINTRKLLVQDGAQISAATSIQASGDGGDVLVNAEESVKVIGIAQNGRFPSSLGAQTQGTGNGGRVKINTRKLLVQDGAQISATTFNQGRGGDVLVNARESVEAIGISYNGRFGSILGARTSGTGNAGRVEIDTGKLILRDGAQISSSTTREGSGNGGDVLVNAKESVEAIGISQISRFVSVTGLVAQTHGVGDGGTVTVNTGRLILQDGAQVSAITFNRGRGGNIIVNARESLEAIGFGSGLRVQTQGAGDGGTVTINTGRFLASKGAQTLATVFDNSEGKGGNINIRASKVELTGTSDNGDPTILFASTRGKGDSGEVTIDTAQLIVREGAQIGAGTFSSGQGGNVFVKASDLVELVGIVPQVPNRPFFRDWSGQRFPSGLFTGSENIGTAGNLRIETENLTLRDGATIAVNNQGRGDAGNLEVVARNVLLDNQAVLSATTTSGQGGNITLKIDDLLLLRRNSKISTSAGIDRAGGDGGNISIDSDLIVAIPNENSDITANAFQGRGGNINIKTQGLFGLEFRNFQTPLSDITASSEFGIAGVVDIDILDVDPAQALTELPADIVDVSRLIGQDFCRVVGQNSEFVVTGRGGLPSSPNETLRANAPWEDLRLVEESEPTAFKLPPAARSEQPKMEDNQPETIVEAQGWISTPNGNVLLTAKPATVTSQGLWLHPLDCQLWKQTSRS